MHSVYLVLALWGIPSLCAPPDIIVDVRVNINIVDNRSQTGDTADEDHFGCCGDDDLDEVLKAQKEQYDSEKAR